jgi:hypothetical protein
MMIMVMALGHVLLQYLCFPLSSSYQWSIFILIHLTSALCSLGTNRVVKQTKNNNGRNDYENYYPDNDNNSVEFNFRLLMC